MPVKPILWRNSIVRYGEEPPEQLLANPLNFRIHPGPQQAALEGAITDLGWLAPIIVNETTGHVIDGHLRVELAISRREPVVPVAYVALTPEQEAEALATFDPIGAMAVVDKGQLDALLREVQTGDAAVQAMLADLAEKSGLDYGNPEPIEDPGARIDRAEELRQKWGTEQGQLWEMGRHRLLCGDSTAAEDVGRVCGNGVATVVFDPPYDAEDHVLNLRFACHDAIVFTDHRHLLDCIDGWGRFRSAFVWDGVTSWYVPGWPLARCKLALWFGKSEYNPDGAHYGEPDKPHTVKNPRGTYNYVPDPRGKHLSTVFQSPNTKEFDGHEHAKPVDWVRMLMGNCTGGDVFDPFLGSGTTAVACEQLGRTCLGIEIDPATLAVCLERLAGAGLEPRLSGA